MVNDGALIGRKEGDYIAGTLPYEVRNPSGDWMPVLVVGEKQLNYKGDSMSCVSFSFTNCIEIQEKHQTGVEVNYSDRFLAVMSGTTRQGNWLWKVADTARNIGLVLEHRYPMPKEPWTWDDYHAPIPEPLLTELKLEGGESKKNNDIAYEWIDLTPESISKHLKHAPLQMVFPSHAVAGVALKIENGIITYFDSGEPFIKTKPLSAFTDALKIVLTKKNMTPIFVHITGTQEYGLMYKSEFVTTIVRFTSEADAKEKLKTDTVDFSKAKEIVI
jgi:hypothetical protein